MTAMTVAPPLQPGVPCPGRLGALRCTQDADHDYGHTYESTSGVPDKHTRTSGE